jgi:hypothetical protein
LKLLALLGDEQLGVTDNVNEQDVPDPNFTSENCSCDIRFLISQNSRRNKPIPIQDIAFTDQRLVNIAPLQFSEETLRIHDFGFAIRRCWNKTSDLIPVCSFPPEKEQAINYAHSCASFRCGEIRVLDSTGKNAPLRSAKLPPEEKRALPEVRRMWGNV